MHGHGLFNWWGFSPPVNLLSYMDGKRSLGDTMQVVVIGAGDPRHLLLMMARYRSSHNPRLRVYVLEAQVELYARVLLLMGASLQQGLGLRERAALLLDLWGNLCLRPTSKGYLELAARRLSISVTDAAQYQTLLGVISAEKLKYRERDAIEAVCRTWYTLTPKQYDPALCWDLRLRHLLKTRYDNRQAEADWAWHMRLAHRIQHLHVNPSGKLKAGDDEGRGRVDGYVGVGSGWGQEFLEWRESGHAFSVGTDATSRLPNTSLASVAMVSEGLAKHRRVGYWGDLLTGPFPALTLAATDPRVAMTHNGKTRYSGSEAALWNLDNLLHELWTHHLLQDDQVVGKQAEETYHHLQEDQAVGEQREEGVDDVTDKEVDWKVVQTQKELEHEMLVEWKAEKQLEMKRETAQLLDQKNVTKNFREKDKNKMPVGTTKNTNTSTNASTNENTDKSNFDNETLTGNTVRTDASNQECSPVCHATETQPTQCSASVILNNQPQTEAKHVENSGGEPMCNASQEWVRCWVEEEGERGTSCRTGLEEAGGRGASCSSGLKEAGGRGASCSSGLKEAGGRGASCSSGLKEAGGRGASCSSGLKEAGGRGASCSSGLKEAGGRGASCRTGLEEAGGRGASCGYLELDGVEIILLSPSRLNALISLPEVEGSLDVVYLSVAMAHLLTPTLLRSHLCPHTKLILETASMLPELTDDQVKEFETRMMSSADEAGWEVASPHPLCHLRFKRR
ncbi:uncharacterized protein Dnaaf3 [Procambarus clarkii]|uniref:uncharacterized protein Dnaaf3 n=1 Tax=Procambarus clarkii TaxID=6728 RepID=UPI0037431015